MNLPSFVLLACAAAPVVGIYACRAPAALPPVPANTGGFVVTLGNDTVSAESFTRTGDRIEGVIVRRVPRTSVVRYVLTLTPAGLPSRLDYTTRLPDGSMIPNGARSVAVTFTGDSVITQIVRDSLVTRRVGARSSFPDLDGAVSFYALPIAALRAMNRDSADFVGYSPGAPTGSVIPVARRDSNRYWLYDFGSPIEIVTDDAGRIVSVDASRTTFRIQSRRQGTVNVSTLATAFAERERAIGPIAALSPRDSVIATIGGARISVGYGRPSARGRRIWGPSGVLGDTLWRTGANASTRFTTDAAISIGGHALPAGTYSLTTLAIPGRYHLIFSAGDAEVLRVPLQAAALNPRVERFTILIEPAAERAGVLRLRWDTQELSTPFRVTSASTP